jgi:hypothetical protein
MSLIPCNHCGQPFAHWQTIELAHHELHCLTPSPAHEDNYWLKTPDGSLTRLPSDSVRWDAEKHAYVITTEVTDD